MTMNALIHHLARICLSERLTPKLLLVPNLRVGHQWLEAVARSGQPVVNVRPQTLKGLALELAGPALAQAGLSLAPAGRISLLVEELLAELQPRLTYFGVFNLGRTGAGLVERTISALRLAGLGLAELRSARLETSAKAVDLALLLEAYLADLARRGLVDYAQALAWARESLAGEPTAKRPLLLLPVDLDLAWAERALVEAWPAGRRLVLAVDQPAGPEEMALESASDLERLRFLARPQAAGPAQGDGTVSFFRAAGEVNEVREVFRTCLAEGLPLDQVEVLYPEAETYVPLLYETASRFGPPGAVPGQGLPLTLAEGLPGRYARPVRALLGWLTWVERGFPQTVLVGLIQDGLLDVGGAAGFGRLAARLRGLPWGRGRERGLALVRARRTALAQSQEARLGEAEELAALESLLLDLLTVAPEPQAPVLAALQAARRFLAERVRAVDELDQFCRNGLVEELDRVLAWLGLDGPGWAFDPWRFLRDLTGRIRLAGSGPRPGCLHAAPLLGGGHSGRPVTFILGLDEGRFPGPDLQDPLLLDGERRNLSPHLATAAGETERRLLGLGQLLARLRGRVWLSYSCRDLVDEAERLPSPAFVSALRAAGPRREGELAELLAGLGRPRGFAPESPERALDEAEWWLNRLTAAPPPAEPLAAVATRYLHLADGLAGAQARQGPDFGPWDGHVPAAGVQANPFRPEGPVLTPGRLETLGRCPRSYFFRHILELEPEEPERPEEVWLAPAEAGSLLHRLFYRFLAGLRGRPPGTADWPQLEALLEEELARWRELVPPPSPEAQANQIRDLRRAARIFLHEEALAQGRPTALELSLGRERPVELALPGGLRIRLTGRLDRLDQDPDGSYFVWDYKTGRPGRSDPADPLQQGRVLQPCLYLALAEAELRATQPQARVAGCGLYFCGLAGRGERLAWPAEELAQGREVAARLCRLLAAGAFAATDEADDCRYCDFQALCDPAEVQASRAKLNHPANAALEPLRRLRRDEDG